ncbi:hypothetical protein R3P38DRAFT_3222838 [Favolaschia claudopus]|uniref:Uncharacterized protein n=1 Tax=Favolaschia claudopus TaxID=2862362 RepID=A0AAV9ZZ04_9AGAR
MIRPRRTALTTVARTPYRAGGSAAMGIIDELGGGEGDLKPRSSPHTTSFVPVYLPLPILHHLPHRQPATTLSRVSTKARKEGLVYAIRMRLRERKENGDSGKRRGTGTERPSEWLRSRLTGEGTSTDRTSVRVKQGYPFVTKGGAQSDKKVSTVVLMHQEQTYKPCPRPSLISPFRLPPLTRPCLRHLRQQALAHHHLAPSPYQRRSSYAE